MHSHHTTHKICVVSKQKKKANSSTDCCHFGNDSSWCLIRRKRRDDGPLHFTLGIVYLICAPIQNQSSSISTRNSGFSLVDGTITILQASHVNSLVYCLESKFLRKRKRNQYNFELDTWGLMAQSTGFHLRHSNRRLSLSSQQKCNRVR